MLRFPPKEVPREFGGEKQMVTIYDVEPSALIEKTADALKKVEQVSIPDWATIVKTGPGQERQPDSLHWWNMRTASILRKVYNRGPIGVSKLRTYYGKKKNRGVKPERFYKAGGKVIRTVLQQLEAAGLIVQVEKGVHKGRVVTPKGRSFLDSIAREVYGPGTNKTKKTGGSEGATVSAADEGSAAVAATAGTD
tara:strand:+ start:1237 stop:1818 length:582 start_codon:yes stop_codon:yes gene_type:complete